MDGEQKKARSRPWTGSGRREKKEWVRLWGPCVSEMKRGGEMRVGYEDRSFY
jgi:hypothetical protein